MYCSVKNGVKMVKFIHTADLHLASPFQGLTEMPSQLWRQVYDSTFAALRRIVDAAIAERVDFVVIAGDIYDGEGKSIAAVDFFNEQLTRLAQQHIPVFMCYGNHDFQQVTAANQSFPANTHVLGNQVTTAALTLATGEQVAITGFSYGQRWISTDVARKYPVKGAVDWQIGLLHGAPYQAGADNHYAPFTVDELESKHYDYWALGHIHKHQELATTPPIAYSGNPQGRHKNEAGSHGYYLVHSEGSRLIPEFKPVAGIGWRTVSVDLDACQTEAAVDRAITSAATSNAVGHLQLCAVQVTASRQQWRLLVENGSLLTHLQSRLRMEETIEWWPYQLTLATRQGEPHLPSLDQRYWAQAKQAVFTTENLAAVIKPLVKHQPLYDQFADHQNLAEFEQWAAALISEREKQDEN